jgi:uncharacterized protein (DUF2062 family)
VQSQDRPQVVFKRRSPRSLLESLKNLAYPSGGWARATSYVVHRLRRLPDTPERIAKGVGAGVFVSFLPLFGLHFVSAVALAWVLRGNIFAALLGTFFGNPFTFPLIVVGAMETGSLLLGHGHMQTPKEVMHRMQDAWGEVRHNGQALFSAETADWNRTAAFVEDVFAPYMLGGTIIGAIVGILAYFVSLPVIRAYRARRQRKLEKRFARARARNAAPGSGQRN